MILQKTLRSPPEGDQRDDRQSQYDPARLLSEHLERAEPDLLRSMLLTS